MNDLNGRYILIHDECGINSFSITTKHMSAVDVLSALLAALTYTLEELGLTDSQARCAIVNALDAVYAKEFKA